VAKLKKKTMVQEDRQQLGTPRKDMGLACTTQKGPDEPNGDNYIIYNLSYVN